MSSVTFRFSDLPHPWAGRPSALPTTPRARVAYVYVSATPARQPTDRAF
jgi:hypothetical protein